MRNNEQRVSVAPISIYLYNLRFLELCFVAKVSFLLVWLQVSIEQSCCGDRFFSYCSCCILMRIGQLKFCVVYCFPFLIFALCANRKKAHCFFLSVFRMKTKGKVFPFSWMLYGYRTCWSWSLWRGLAWAWSSECCHIWSLAWCVDCLYNLLGNEEVVWCLLILWH